MNQFPGASNTAARNLYHFYSRDTTEIQQRLPMNMKCVYRCTASHLQRTLIELNDNQRKHEHKKCNLKCHPPLGCHCLPAPARFIALFSTILFAIVCILVYWFIWTRNCAHIPNRPANLRIQLKSDCVEKIESPSGSGGAGEREKEAKHRTARLSIQIGFRPSVRTIQSQYVGESRKILTEMWTGGGHFFSRDPCVWEYWMQYAN